MLRYEWEKMRHNPAVLFAAVILVIFKLTVLTVQYANVEFTTVDTLIDTRYNGLLLPEINQRLSSDLADANAALDQDIATTYADGKISIDEYRLWREGTEERYVTANALFELKDRVSELMVLNETYENVQADRLTSSVARCIAKWKTLRLLHEQAWTVMEALDTLSFGGYWVLALVITIFSELSDSGVDVFVRSAGNGWKNTYLAKQELTIIVILAFWLLECFIDYVLPGIIWGYGAADTAIQSVRSCSSIILPLSLYEYLVSCCLLRLCAYLVLYSISVVFCRFLHSSNRTFAICTGIYMLIDVLNLWNGFVDKLVSPSLFFRQNPNPTEIAAVLSAYCSIFILLQCGESIYDRLIGSCSARLRHLSK